MIFACLFFPCYCVEISLKVVVKGEHYTNSRELDLYSH